MIAWNGMIGKRVVFRVTLVDDPHIVYDYYDAVVVNNVSCNDGTELVLLDFGNGDKVWAWVDYDHLETSNRRFDVVYVYEDGERYEE